MDRLMLSNGFAKVGVPGGDMVYAPTTCDRLSFPGEYARWSELIERDYHGAYYTFDANCEKLKGRLMWWR